MQIRKAFHAYSYIQFTHPIGILQGWWSFMVHRAHKQQHLIAPNQLVKVAKPAEGSFIIGNPLATVWLKKLHPLQCFN